MPLETGNWLIAINGGCCPETTAKGILNNKPDASKDSQKWVVEKGDAPEKVAFYNVAEKKYLRAKNGNAATRVELGEKQWWTLERDGDAGTYWIKCDDFSNAYLCNAYAKHTEDNTVYMWPKQAAWQHSMRWYIQEAGVHDFTTGTGGSEESSGAEAAEKEKALSEKEKSLAEKERTIVAKEAEQKTQADQLTAKEKELEEQAKAKTETSNDASQAEKEWADKLADLQRQLDGLREKEREAASKEAEAQKVRQQHDDKTAELQRREEDLKQQNTTATGDADKLRAENSDLKQEMARLKKQLEDSRKPSAPEVSQGVDSQELARLKDENRRLRDLFVDHILKAQDSDRGSAPAPTKAPITSTPAATAPDSAPKSVSFATPLSEQTAPKPVPARRKGPAVHDRPHVNGSASPKPSANTSKPSAQSSAATDKPNRKPQPVKSTASAKPSPSSQQVSELEHQPSAATDKPNSKPQPVKPTASTKAPSSSLQLSELEQLKQENNRLKQQAEQSQKEKGHKGRSELPNGANTGPKIIARPNSQKGAAVKGQGADEDAIVFNCGHVVHPPPRKLERRVLGIMYE